MTFILKHWQGLAFLAVAAAAALYVGNLKGQIASLNREADGYALEITNQAAVADTQRTIYLDSLTAVTRAVEQVAIERDSLAEALDLALVARTEVLAVVDTAAGVDTSTTPEGTPLAWHIYDQPFTIDLSVKDRALEYQIALDPIPLILEVGCTSGPTGRIREARVVVIGPSWASLTLQELRQVPGVCNPSRLIDRTSQSLLAQMRLPLAGAITGAAVAVLYMGPDDRIGDALISGALFGAGIGLLIDVIF